MEKLQRPTKIHPPIVDVLRLSKVYEDFDEDLEPGPEIPMSPDHFLSLLFSFNLCCDILGIL